MRVTVSLLLLVITGAASSDEPRHEELVDSAVWSELRPHYEPELCGPIALFCVCKYYGIQTTIDELATICGRQARGVTVADIVRAAGVMGLTAGAYKSSISHLRTLGGPAIVDYPRGHYSVFLGWEGNQMRILDPPKEVQLKRIADFAQAWGGHVITFALPDDATNRAERERSTERGGDER